MIPTDRSDAVIRGLHATFEVAEFEEISRITKGHTPSLVFRIVVRGLPYLLKIITRAEDQTRHYTVMQAAAEGGVAPRVLYASIPDHVSITDFVGTIPLSMSDALVRLPGLLRTLHALPGFARAPFNTTWRRLNHLGRENCNRPKLGILDLAGDDRRGDTGARSVAGWQSPSEEIDPRKYAPDRT